MYTGKFLGRLLMIFIMLLGSILLLTGIIGIIYAEIESLSPLV